MRQYLKLMFLFAAGGLLYNLLELFYRGWTHWTMFFLGGLCFIALGTINEVIPWAMPLWQQMLIGAGIITGLEFATGCIVNLWLGWVYGTTAASQATSWARCALSFSGCGCWRRWPG